MEAVLSLLTPCPRCVVTDHGSRRGRASRTVRREARRNGAIQCQIVPPFWRIQAVAGPGIGDSWTRGAQASRRIRQITRLCCDRLKRGTLSVPLGPSRTV